MRVLVTGGSGFIGQNLFQFMTTLEEEPEIRLFDRLYGQDLTRWADVETAWEWEPEAVINLASDTHIDTSIGDPMKFWDNNARLMINVLEACRLHDCRLVHVSSSEVYGSSQYVPQDERHPISPQSPYAATKAAQDAACNAWFHTYGLDVAIVRPFNQFGTYQQLEKMIPKTMRLILENKPIPVYGTGTAKRDWVYVKETVRGLWAALEKLPKGRVVNLATGTAITNLELVDAIKEVMVAMGHPGGSKLVTVRHVEDRAGHVYSLRGATERAKELLGWEYAYSLKDALRETAEWYVSQHWGLVSR